MRTSRATDVPADLAAQRRRSALTGRAAMFAVVLVVLVLSFAYPLRSWFDQRAQVAELHERTIADERANADLAAAIERWNDPKYVEAQARQRLRFVMPGDAPYVVIGGDGEPAITEGADGTAATAATSTALETEWWERLWSTVEEADRPTADLVSEEEEEGSGAADSGGVGAATPGGPAADPVPDADTG